MEEADFLGIDIIARNRLRQNSHTVRTCTAKRTPRITVSDHRTASAKGAQETHIRLEIHTADRAYGDALAVEIYPLMCGDREQQEVLREAFNEQYLSCEYQLGARDVEVAGNVVPLPVVEVGLKRGERRARRPGGAQHDELLGIGDAHYVRRVCRDERRARRPVALLELSEDTALKVRM